MLRVQQAPGLDTHQQAGTVGVPALAPREAGGTAARGTSCYRSAFLRAAPPSVSSSVKQEQ